MTKRSIKTWSKLQSKALRRLVPESFIERLSLLQVETMGGDMSNFDWKGYAKDLQKDNSFMRDQVTRLGLWVIGLGFTAVGLIILAITLWRA
jgi:hypothetical protein